MKCHHCGDHCKNPNFFIEEKHFCCNGCKVVFEIINNNNLNSYYKLEENPGIRINSIENSKYDYLDNKDIITQIINFQNNEITKATLYIPQIHCSACIWLLENSNRINKNILDSKVNFSTKMVEFTFLNTDFSLKKLVVLLCSIGYEPDLKRRDKKHESTILNNSIYYKIGIAGFCFGNIMLLSFPEYLGIDSSYKPFQLFFGILSLLLSIPVMLYSASDYFKGAYSAFNQRFINMDIPIVLGISTLFIRSSYEIISQSGSGYFDSLAGLIFFLIIGKWFQQKTFNSLSFERDYKSYFPLGVNKVTSKGLKPVKIEQLKLGDIIEIKNQEVIPVDCILISKNANIDYSFVTGESLAESHSVDDLLYAGGRQLGKNIKLRVVKKVNNSYLTQLWNQEVFKKEKKIENVSKLSNIISKYFTIIVLAIALITATYWLIEDVNKLWNSVTSVLIIACPCALALSIPFTFGNIIRFFGEKGIYLKNDTIIEKVSLNSAIVFDKTGTITHSDKMDINLKGHLTIHEKQLIKSLVSNSNHPLSKAIGNYFKLIKTQDINKFKEVPGKGIMGTFKNIQIKIGSADFVGMHEHKSYLSTQVFITFNDKLAGIFTFNQHYRKGLKRLIRSLKRTHAISLLSGDNNLEKSRLSKEFGIDHCEFNQSPIDKLEHIKKKQDNGKTVIMIGDGLNDAGALKQSDIGIAISDNVYHFSPACDIILDATNFEAISRIIKICKQGVKIVKISFIISFLYNIIGIYYAVSGQLSPIIAAILMPLSSITIVIFTTISTNIISKRTFLKNEQH